jgi:hypothetical protein
LNADRAPQLKRSVSASILFALISMNVRLVLAAAFFVLADGFCLAANSSLFAIIDAVNAKLPSNQQFNRFGWGPLKLHRVHQAYRRLYPGGGLLRREGILFVLMCLCLGVAGWLFGLGVLSLAWLGGGGIFLAWLMYFRKPSKV